MSEDVPVTMPRVPTTMVSQSHCLRGSDDYGHTVGVS